MQNQMYASRFIVGYLNGLRLETRLENTILQKIFYIYFLFTMSSVRIVFACINTSKTVLMFVLFYLLNMKLEDYKNIIYICNNVRCLRL